MMVDSNSLLLFFLQPERGSILEILHVGSVEPHTQFLPFPPAQTMLPTFARELRFSPIFRQCPQYPLLIMQPILTTFLLPHINGLVFLSTPSQWLLLSIMFFTSTIQDTFLVASLSQRCNRSTHLHLYKWNTLQLCSFASLFLECSFKPLSLASKKVQASQLLQWVDDVVSCSSASQPHRNT